MPQSVASWGAGKHLDSDPDSGLLAPTLHPRGTAGGMTGASAAILGHRDAAVGGQ